MSIRVLVIIVGLALSFGFDCWAEPAYYFVIHEDSKGQLTVGHHQRVDLAELPRSDDSIAWNGDNNHLERHLTARVVKAGTVHYSTEVASAGWLRGEFAPYPGSSSEMDAHHFALAEFDYVLRVPTSGLLQIDRPGNSFASDNRLEIDLDRLAISSTYMLGNSFASSAIVPIVESGDPANRLDILILAEGYTAGQEALFQQDAINVIDEFFGLTPYKEYRNLVNVSGLFLVSNQVGTTKPICTETPGQPAVSADTALNASFCSNGIRRLVSINTSKALAAAAGAANWDRLMVLVNDGEYGGSGGTVTVFTKNKYAVQLAQHEFGHNFTLLADEYEAPYPGYPTCSDAVGTTAKCPVNVTDLLAPLKWQDWVTAGTPIPTATARSDPVAAGAWQGARYVSTGMYRQCFSGIMRTFSTPFFCHVDGEAFPARLYAYGWGTPGKGVSNIDSSQPSGSNLTSAIGSKLSGSS